MPEIVDELTPGGIRLLTLNRPESLNAMTPSMEQAFYEFLAAAETDPATRVVVVTGAGRGFCAGADIAGSVDDLIQGGAPLPQRAANRYPPTMGTPVIAAVNGACAGLGLAIALHADVRFVAEEAKLTTAFVRRGLIAEHGMAWLLPRLVGRGRTLDLLLSGRVFTGADALTYGLAEFVVPRAQVQAAAMTYASALAHDCSPRAMATVKRQLADDDRADPFTALLTADNVTHESFGWSDIREGIRVWQDGGRAPEFDGWPPTSG